VTQASKVTLPGARKDACNEPHRTGTAIAKSAKLKGVEAMASFEIWYEVSGRNCLLRREEAQSAGRKFNSTATTMTTTTTTGKAEQQRLRKKGCSDWKLACGWGWDIRVWVVGVMGRGCWYCACSTAVP